MALPPKSERTSEETRTFMDKVRKRFQLANDAEASVRQEALTDQEYCCGQQWPPKAKQIRDDDNRPCLTINRIPQFIHQVTNEQRQQKPAVAISPSGGAESYGTDELRQFADIWQGLIRHIEVQSDAETAYDTAFEDQVGISFGWWRIITEYADTDTFDQEIRIKRILDPFSVYVDPSAQEPDRSDMKWAFVTTRMSRDEFKLKYQDTGMAETNFFSDFDNGPGGLWLTDDDIQIAEYYEIEEKKRELQTIKAPAESLDAMVSIFGPDKGSKFDDNGDLEITAFADEYKPEELPEGALISNQRDVLEPHVKWYKITGYDILDETDWPGKFIPLCGCFGDEVILNGKKMIISLTRFIRDSQTLLNYFRSQQAEVIALSPKAPFIGPVGAFKTKSQQWQAANNQNFAYLEYDMVMLPNGQVAPPPQRNSAEPPIQAINQATRDADEDLKAGTGIYAPALGEPSNETSGRAILARQKESDTSNFHFVDNFRRAIRHTGRILMDLIPHIYDRKERIIRIVKPDNSTELVMINGHTEYKGKPVFFDPNVGRYDVTISTEPSAASKMDEAFTLLMQFAQADPQLMQIAPDLVFRSAPLPGNLGMQIADRFKAMLPPAVQAVANGNQPTDPAAQAQAAQAAQMIQMLTAELKKLQTIIQMKIIETSSKERIANLQGMVTLLAADLKAKAENAQVLTEQEYGAIQHRLNLLHEGMTVESGERLQLTQMAQDAQMQQQQQQHEQQMAATQAQQQAPAAPAQAA